MKAAVTVGCGHCGHINAISYSKMYGGYEGVFICEYCKRPLEHLHEVLDDE